jgi:hypothetical protein
MKQLFLLGSLFVCSSAAYAATPWSMQLSFDKPYFQSATTSTVNIQQSPSSSTLTPIVNTNKLGSASMGVDASVIYHFMQRSAWHIGAGLNLNKFNMPVSGVGKIKTYTLDQYNYNVSIYDYDALANIDYCLNKWTFGGQVLLGASRLHAGSFTELDPSTSYGSKIQWHFNYGVQLHALYNVDPHLQMGLQAAYRDDGTANLGARTNIYKSIGTIEQKVRFAYVGAVFGIQF